MVVSEVVVFIIYLLFMIAIGVYFFVKQKNGGEKTYFLGGRKMGAWVTALSAGASDMSAWVLMGLPTSIYAYGLGQTWIPIGLVVGYALSWVFEASRLRGFSIVSDDSITIPQFLTNRFKSKSKVLQIICAVVFICAYTIYAASSVKACGTLFNTVIGMDPQIAMYLAAIIIITYTFLGGFSAVCWTDFFQGLLILGAMMIAPIFAVAMLDTSTVSGTLNEGYFNMFSSWQDIVSGLAWGLGYFGMPHIIIRFMSLKDQKSIKKSAVIGISWTTILLIFATLVGVVGRLFVGYDDAVVGNSLVFITMVRMIFPGVISGVLLSAVLAASMSTADSQLLSAASAFASDVYKPVIRKGSASDKEMLWAGRYVVLAIAVIALMIASNPNAGSIMALVSNAWGVFGAAFGPVILLAIYWRNFNFKGAVAGIVAGALVDILFLAFCSSTGVYELLPGFVCVGLAAIVTAKLTGGADDEVKALFDKAVSYTE
ncbi:MAG: sodium/proline symporter [Spirochaetales bacterium]|nr:sodium/proline symporter [Candidatus Physcosoma equi]